MPVVGSTITVDLHITEDADLDSLQAAVRQKKRADPELARGIRASVETHAKKALEDSDVGAYDLSVSETLVTDRLAGAPRERITVDLDVEGDKSVVAAVDDAVGAPERARIADAVEAVTANHLAENDLSNGADVIVSVTPIQFR
jgi:hypothetical protein